jgi:hypothetical protein
MAFSSMVAAVDALLLIAEDMTVGVRSGARLVSNQVIFSNSV